MTESGLPSACNPSLRPNAWRGAVLCAAVVLAAVVYSFRFMSLLHAKDAVFCVCVVALAVLTAARRGFSWDGFAGFAPLWWFLVMALFSAWLLPAHVFSETAARAGYWALLLAAAGLSRDLLDHEPWRRGILDALAGSTALVAILGLIQYANLCPALFPVFEGYTQRVYSVFGNQDLYGGYLALGAPLLVTGALRDRDRVRAAANALGLATLTPGLLISGCRSAWAAAAIGCLIALLQTRGCNPLSRREDRRRLMALAGMLAVLVAATVWLAPDATVQRVRKSFSTAEPGVRARLWMWKATAHMIGDAPLLGVGLGNYAYWSPRYLGAAAPGDAAQEYELKADQPHCEPLRIMAETGALGTLCCVWMLVRLLHARGPEWGALSALLCFAMFNGPFDSVAHAFAGLLLAGMLLASRTTDQRLMQPSAIGIIAAGTILVSGFVIWSTVIPSYLLRSAQDTHLAAKQKTSAASAASFPLYARATRFPWPNAAAHRDYGIALADAAQDADAVRELETALRGIDTGDVYLALAILASRQGNREDAKRWAIECLQRWPDNPEARALLAD